MRLLRGLIASLSVWAAMSPAQAQQQPSTTQVGKMVEALRQAAPQTGKSNDGLYSAWQVTPQIIPDWSKRCVGRQLTPEQFEASPEAARSVVSCITRRELNKQLRATGNETAAVRSVACWWMTGNYTGCNSGPTATYVQKVVSFYQQGRSQPVASPPASNQRRPAATSRPAPAASPSAAPTASPSAAPAASPSPVPSASP